MTYRSDLDALALRHAALEVEVDQRTRELDQAKRLLDEAHVRSRLPVLDNIRVASPCSASWDAMTGDARVRACGDCKKSVYNLSELTRDEAEALIIEHEGRLCVRYFQRKDGTILLKDCVIGVRKQRRRRLVALGLAAGAAAGIVTYKTVAHTDELQTATGVSPSAPGGTAYLEVLGSPRRATFARSKATSRPSSDTAI